MGEVIPFKRPTLADKHKGKSLCTSGFHKWELVRDQPFASKQGKLVTQYRCTRCGTTKIQSK